MYRERKAPPQPSLGSLATLWETKKRAREEEREQELRREERARIRAEARRESLTQNKSEIKSRLKELSRMKRALKKEIQQRQIRADNSMLEKMRLAMVQEGKIIDDEF